MWCRSGWTPVAIDVRHTGVSDGKVVTARRYSPTSASAESVGADRSPTAFSKTDGVRPSITIRITRRLARKRAKTGVLLPGPPARARRDDRQRNRFEVPGCRDDRDEEHRDADQREDDRRPSGRAAATKRAAYKRCRPCAAEGRSEE